MVFVVGDLDLEGFEIGLALGYKRRQGLKLSKLLGCLLDGLHKVFGLLLDGLKQIFLLLLPDFEFFRLGDQRVLRVSGSQLLLRKFSQIAMQLF
jgi:hypothetical protein